MQEQGRLIKGLGIYAILCTVLALMNTMPVMEEIPAIGCLKAAYLFGLSILMTEYYEYRLSEIGPMRKTLTAIPWLILLWMLMRGVKYLTLLGYDTALRYLWYGYYIPQLLIALLSLYGALFIGLRDSERLPRKWNISIAITIVLIILIMTNDLHQLAFSFNPGFVDYDTDYSRGIVYYAAIVWTVILYVSTAVILARKCMIAEIKRFVWLPVVIMISWQLYTLLYSLGKADVFWGRAPFLYPEAACLSVATFWGSVILIGMIPTNESYIELMQKCSLSVQITNNKMESIYKSEGAAELTKKQMKRRKYSMLDENTRLFRVDITGGYGYWQQDISELNRLNAELDEIKGKLIDESEIRRYENELKKKKVSVETRTRLYDDIAVHVRKQTEYINMLITIARMELEKYDKFISYACVLGVYIKRSANLMILAEESDIPLTELRISIAESLRYLNFMGIPGDCIGGGNNLQPSDRIQCMFDVYEQLIEKYINELNAIYVAISETPVPSIKLTMEGVSDPVENDLKELVVSKGMELTDIIEDDVCYVRISFRKGGEF